MPRFIEEKKIYNYIFCDRPLPNALELWIRTPYITEEFQNVLWKGNECNYCGFLNRCFRENWRNDLTTREIHYGSSKLLFQYLDTSVLVSHLMYLLTDSGRQQQRASVRLYISFGSTESGSVKPVYRKASTGQWFHLIKVKFHSL